MRQNRIKKVSTHAGIGFGVYKDYGPTQILYINRKYVPDGNGLIKNYKSVGFGEQVEVNDELAFYLLKDLSIQL